MGRIKSWTNKFLSRAGKEVLLKNVIQSIPTYALSVFLLPLELGRDIEKVMNSFWWGCEGERSRGIRWKRWDNLCLPKDRGGLGFRKIREFNVALLGKQAWRLIKYPNSLVARIFKAKYFPRHHFLEAKIGCNPSFVWRSILEAQGVIKSNYIWRVGDGASINIWTDPWLPNSQSPYIQPSLTDNQNATKVQELFNQAKTAWDVSRLERLFTQHDIDQICSIPVVDIKTEDTIIWSGEEKGEYTVKSCYKKLVGNLQNHPQFFWSRVWKLHVPPKIKSFLWQVCSGSLPTQAALRIKHVQIPPHCQICNREEETTYHIFTSCDLAKACWNLIGNTSYQSVGTFLDWLELNFNSLDDLNLCKLISICWKIWEARHDKVWNQLIIPPDAVVSGAITFLLEWQTVNSGSPHHSGRNTSEDKWIKPQTGWKKLNIDAALDTGNKKFGFGFVLRDDLGKFVAAKMVPKAGLIRADEAEVMGMKEALKWLKEINCDEVQIETDCIKTVNNINNHACLSYFDLILNDVREVAKGFSKLSYSFAKRSANKVAHLLAREALLKSDCEDCFVVPFPFICHALDVDFY